MNIDVFTLFPAWFDWFRTQRHVAVVQRRGLQVVTGFSHAAEPIERPAAATMPR